MWERVFTKPFLADVKAAKKDKPLILRLRKKIDKVMKNPEHFPPKRYDLKGQRSTHVGSFVLVYKIKGEQVIFLKFKHHDHAYA